MLQPLLHARTSAAAVRHRMRRERSQQQQQQHRHGNRHLVRSRCCVTLATRLESLPFANHDRVCGSSVTRNFSGTQCFLTGWRIYSNTQQTIFMVLSKPNMSSLLYVRPLTSFPLSVTLTQCDARAHAPNVTQAHASTLCVFEIHFHFNHIVYEYWFFFL